MAGATSDHDAIRTWTEGKGGEPAAVARVHDVDHVGIVRVMFPCAEQSQHGALTELARLYAPDGCSRPSSTATRWGSARTTTARPTLSAGETPARGRPFPARPYSAATFISTAAKAASSERIRWSMSAAVCSGDGVMRRRSVPRGTVG